MMKLKREKFIEEIETLLNNGTELSQDALDYFEEIKKYTRPNGSENTLTENGAMILDFMKKEKDKHNNLFSAQMIGDGIFKSSKSVSGSMKKLITCGYVTKSGKSPVMYSLVE